MHNVQTFAEIAVLKKVKTTLIEKGIFLYKIDGIDSADDFILDTFEFTETVLQKYNEELEITPVKE